MQVWVVMKNEWDGGEGSRDSVHSMWSSEAKADAESRKQTEAFKDYMNGPRFEVEGPFQVS